MGNTVDLMAALALQSWPRWLPCAWPHDGLQHDKGSGKQLEEQYAGAGLALMGEHAQFPDKSFGVEAGIADMHDRMKTGRWKVVRTCLNWLEEYRPYHRKDGLIVKERDDTISASRYGYMMRRYWSAKPRQKSFHVETSWRTA